MPRQVPGLINPQLVPTFELKLRERARHHIQEMSAPYLKEMSVSYVQARNSKGTIPYICESLSFLWAEQAEGMHVLSDEEGEGLEACVRAEPGGKG